MLLETDSFLDSIFTFIAAVSSNQSLKMPEDPQAKDAAEEPREVEEEDDEEEDEEYRRGRRHRRDRERSPNARQRSRSGSQGYNRRDYHHSHHERDYRSDHSSTAQRPPRICHQFLSRGSCDRGSSCRYEHPASPLNFIPPLINPHDAALIAAAVANGGVIPFNPRSHNVDRRRRGYHHHQFSTSRPTLSSTRLILDKIPPDCCNVAKINEYFGKFGNLVNLSVQADQNRALLQYEKPEEALAAFRSPEVIFDNRFVKLFWDANDTGAAVRPRSWNAEGASKLQEVKAIPHVQPQDEQHLRKQEVLRSMHEFQRQKQDLLQKYIQQQKDLLQRLEAGNLDDTARQELLTSLKSIDSVIGSIQVSIQAKPTATAESSSNNTAITQTSAPILRGGPGFYRSYQQQQAPFKPRPIQSYRLDLRPTSLCLKPIPAQVGRDLGSLRKFFEPYGEIRTLVLGEDGQSAIVTYANRHLAEKVLMVFDNVIIILEGSPFHLQSRD